MSFWKLCKPYMADLYPGSKNKWGGADHFDLIEQFCSYTLKGSYMTGKHINGIEKKKKEYLIISWQIM